MEATSLPRARALLLPRRLLASVEDDRLVDQLRHGNSVAFEVIYDRHHRGILAYCRHLLGSLEEAEDAVQHTFVAAHDGILAGDREIKLKAWLYTIARNRCLSVLRARREYAAELDEAATAGLSDEVQHRADLRELLADLRELPEPQRAALVLAEVADLAHSDIADVLGCDVAKVKSLVFQARSGLIERRQARETPCEEIREQLANLRGGSLRRGPLRRHLKSCPGCAAYRQDVKRQRQMLAIALPVIPSIGLRDSALAAVGLGGAGGAAGAASVAGGGAAAGSALAGGGAAGTGGIGAAVGALAAKAGAAKVALAVLASTAAVGGGTVAVTQQVDGDDGATAPAGQQDGRGAPAEGDAPSGVPPAVPGADDDDLEAEERSDRERARRRARRRRGIDETTGEHRGERGRDNARTRGRGLQRGLEGTQPRGGAEAPGRADREARRRAERRRNGTAPRRQPLIPPRVRAPRPDRAPQPAPGPAPEPAPETAPDPEPLPEAGAESTTG